MSKPSMAGTVLLMLGFSAWLFADSAMPRMQTVEPLTAQVGDVVKVLGENLDRANVAALYLTDGKHDIKVTIVEETASYIVFRVPPDAATGRLALMVLTTGKSPRLIEEPVKLTIQ